MTKGARRMLATMDRAVAAWHIPVVGRAKGRLIRRLIDRHRPRRAVEIGSLLGYSAILIAGSLPAGGRLVCIEVNPFLASLVEANVAEAGLGKRVKVVGGDALRAIPFLPGRFDFVFLDAVKEDYLDYLRQLEPKLTAGAVVVADNTGIAGKAVAPYLEYVRAAGGGWDSREHVFGDHAREVSVRV
ncbi:MAG: class I SAM-dependent methyltransferase [Candidatus Rokubacteria bacterium]|nr:class I SAM-dependent methyltransferase [Candidatus Rokubacteria bacterium]